MKIWISLTGGLGNQLFQYAAARSFAGSTDVSLITSIGKPRQNSDFAVELLSFTPINQEAKVDSHEGNLLISKVGGYLLRRGVSPRKWESFKVVNNLTNLIAKIVISLHFHSCAKLFLGESVGYFQHKKPERESILIGYFQSYRWAMNPDVLVHMRNFKPANISEELSELEKLSLSEKPLIVHVRLGDYKSEANFGLLGSSYYVAAIQKHLGEYPHKAIWVFSDEILLAKQIIQEQFEIPIRWISKVGDSSAENLEAMRYGHGYVIANSTFSWWAAFLTHNVGALVTVPKPWFIGMDDPIDLIPPGWTQLSRDI